MKHFGKIQQLISLVICLIFILAVSIRRDGKILGHDIEQISNGNTDGNADGGDTLRILDDGTVGEYREGRDNNRGQGPGEYRDA